MQQEHNLTDEMIAGRRPDSHDHLPEDMPRWMSHTIVAIDTFSLWVGRAVSWLTLPLMFAMATRSSRATFLPRRPCGPTTSAA